MYNKRKLYDKEIQKSLSTLSINVDGNNFDSYYLYQCLK